MFRVMSCAAAIAAGVMACAAEATTMNFVMTADNHYAIYNFVGGSGGPGTTLSFVGTNEIGSAGSPGEYNWSEAEAWSFTNTTGQVYVAAWSDDSYSQALLAQVFADTLPLHSGNAAWEVYPTNLDLDDFDIAPTTTQMEGYISTADAGSLWETPYVGGNNGVGPWGTIAGITNDARWTWWNNPNQPDPLNGGSADGEFIIFRLTVPTPGVGVVAGLGMLMASRRRR
jgi:hypothetical protein